MRSVGKSALGARGAKRMPQEPEVVKPIRQEKPLSDESRVPVPQTDTGR